MANQELHPEVLNLTSEVIVDLENAKRKMKIVVGYDEMFCDPEFLLQDLQMLIDKINEYRS